MQRGPRGAAAHPANLNRARARSGGGKRSLEPADEGDENDENDENDGDGDGDGDGGEAAGGGGGAGSSSRSGAVGPSGRVAMALAPKRRGTKQQRVAASGGAAAAPAGVEAGAEGDPEATNSRKVHLFTTHTSHFRRPTHSHYAPLASYST